MSTFLGSGSFGRDGLSDDKANLSPVKLNLADIGLELGLAKQELKIQNKPIFLSSKSFDNQG